jgi:drug/metabolite transporter (DMT)-like permease
MGKLKGRQEVPHGKKDLFTGGICCGVLLFLASITQQIGMQYTTVGKAGFLTACYIVLVPIFGIFIGRKCGRLVWLGVGFAVVGLYLLCMTEALTIGKGDIWVLICAVLFTFHILVIDHFTVRVDGVKMSCIQFFVCGILSGIFMFAMERPEFSDILLAGGPILYAGILSSGVAYTLQIVGQKDMNPTVASLILSLESVMSVIAGFVVLHQALTKRELLGCVLMFCAIILAQLPERQKQGAFEQKEAL